MPTPDKRLTAPPPVYTPPRGKADALTRTVLPARLAAPLYVCGLLPSVRTLGWATLLPPTLKSTPAAAPPTGMLNCVPRPGAAAVFVVNPVNAAVLPTKPLKIIRPPVVKVSACAPSTVEANSRSAFAVPLVRIVSFPSVNALP